MTEQNYAKKHVEKLAKVIFGSFGVYIGVAIIGEVVLLFITDENYFEYIFNPLVTLTVMIISAPFLWKYMK
ncbi:MAG: hypothetical protein AMJ53_00670 [Gammaproteobacteria bacterium SG8_11]|nr:MAG: hypothetical protein AMJ53_00670 [Gammaproteobacteria bacterium SG8_11]